MNHIVKTAIFAGLAIVLVVVAWAAVPQQRPPSLFNDQGERFYPEFQPLGVTSVEVASWNETKNEPRVFLVQYEDSRWTIPSHDNYPADAKDELAKTAGVVDGLAKGEIRSDREADFALYGVVDPLNEISVAAQGRGRRVILKDKTGKLLSDLIIGDAVKDKSGHYFVRKGAGAGSNRTYDCEIDAGKISTRFADWVNTSLLDVKQADMQRLTLDDYHLDRNALASRGEITIVPEGTYKLERGSDNKWALAGLQKNEEVNTARVDSLADTLAKLSLVGVRRRPAGLQRLLSQLAKGEQVESLDAYIHLSTLQSIGFYVGRMPDKPGYQLVANDGEIHVRSKDGVVYRLLLGETVYGESEDLTAATAAEKEALAGKKVEEKKQGAEHHYLIVEADFDPTLLGPAPEAPKLPAAKEGEDAKQKEAAQKAYDDAKTAYDQKLKDYQDKGEKGRERAQELLKRFGDWYYVIADQPYKDMRLSRKDLVQPKKEEPEKPVAGQPKPGPDVSLPPEITPKPPTAPAPVPVPPKAPAPAPDKAPTPPEKK